MVSPAVCLDGELKLQLSLMGLKRARWGFKKVEMSRMQRPEGWSDAGGCMVSSGRSHRSAADNSWSTLGLDVVLTAASADEKGDTRVPEHTPQEKLLTSTLEAPRPEATQEAASIWRDGSMGNYACFESMRL